MEVGYGMTVDISGAGIAFDALADLQPGEDVIVTIAAPRRSGPPAVVRGRASVVRVDKSRRGKARIGATIEWIDEPEGDWFESRADADSQTA
jgi:hypothetical protein